MRPRILVADDNPANLELMLYLLKSMDYDAVGVSDGVTAYETAKSQTFALILADILMPGIDGYELVRRLKRGGASAEAPIIAVTALAMAGDRERIESAGFDGYLSKPIDPRAFAGQIDRFLKLKRDPS